MPDTKENASVIERLTRKGDPGDRWRWREGDPDYVAEFALTQTHIPALIEVVRRWGEDEDPDEEGWAAPVHAWRAAAQLRAVELVEPLLAMQNRLDEQGNEWYSEEFPLVFGMIGATALSALSAYLADRDNLEFPRVSAACGLCEIGKRHPETRRRVVEVLTEELAKHEPEVYSLYGCLVGYLIALGAVESAEVIERAYAAGVVDETVCGDWAVVREELGVTGLGLVPDRPRPRPQNPYSRFSAWVGPSVPADPGDPDRRRQKDRKAKAKRKQQKQSRKRNRKRR